MHEEKKILLAEDDPNDVAIVQKAFRLAGYDNPFIVVKNGEEAIAYLEGAGEYSDGKRFPVPALMLLDIKMPRVDGFEVLQWVRGHAKWKYLPVIVLTNSYYGPDVNRAYYLGANSFLTKPEDLQEYVRAVQQVVHFWLAHNTSMELEQMLGERE